MATIRVLPSQLASQIAAGEVVERPASALKELIENALDAGARRCDVEIEAGGITRLSVRDDGSGMDPEDARLAVERHATSKLRDFADLGRIASYGFRGEALPSIASVSRLSIETRPARLDAGTRVVVQGGADPEISEIGMAAGTLVEVRDLFYNVPARRKFLRSSATEAGHVAEVVDNAALGSPDVTFTLKRDGRKAREWLRAASRAERVQSFLSGEELATCQGDRGPLLVEAYLGRPERAKSGATGLKLFCNNRAVRDRAVLGTIAQAFGSVLERGRYPRGVVYLDLPPELLDVNVHPQKLEVRFADPRAVTDGVYQILSQQLARAFSLPGPVGNRWAAPASEGLKRGPAVDTNIKNIPVSIFRVGEKQTPRWAPSEATDERTSSPQQSTPQQLTAQPAAKEPSEPLASAPFVRHSEFGWSDLRFIAQVKATYLVCEGRDALYIIDQHAAAERVLFHRLKEQYRATSVGSQALLFPVSVEVTAAQSELLEARQAEVLQLGFDVRVHGETTVSVHATPKLLQRGSPERLLLDLLAELSRSGRAFSDAVDIALATMACHGSVRSGDVLSAQEASSLLADLDQVDFAGHCPHGRPIVASTSWAELERKVGRR